MNPADSRILPMDGLRGIAVMGILLMNIAGFALPDAAYLNPLAAPDPSDADIWTWAILFVLVDGKMRALFALLFGAGIAIAADRAEEAGRDGQQTHVRRMGWLLVFGLVHAWLVWPGDILTLYAAMGMAAWFFVDRPPGALIGWGAVLLILALLNVATLHSGLDAKTLHEGFGVPGPATMADEIATMRSGYATILAARLTEHGLQPIWQIMLSGPETLAMFLFGMAAARSGLFTAGWPRARFLQIAAWGYAIGLPPAILLAATMWRSGFDPAVMAQAGVVAALPARWPLVVAHAALILWWMAGPPTRLKARIAAAGRAAFTNYLGASLLMTSLFYGYGLGLFAALGRTELIGVVAATWLLMLAWSKPWLDRFVYGPAEWLWRSLVAGKRVAMIRTRAIATKSQ